MISSLFLAQQHLVRAGYYDGTFLHPLGATVLAILGTLMLALPRRFATFPFLALICFVPTSQRLAIAGLDFNLVRVLMMIGWLRVLIRGEAKTFEWTKIDKLFLGWHVVKACVYVLNGGGSMGDIIYMGGKTFEGCGVYFLVRFLVRDWGDLRRIALMLSILVIPVAVMFVIEKQTGRNPTAVFGGVMAITPIRQGKLRAVGAIGTHILAGCYWAAWMPVMGALLWRQTARLAGWIGVICAVFIVFATASTTPLGALMTAFLGAALFPLRHMMREIRLGVVLMLCGLHMVMNAPVWHLISRIDLVGGSQGYQRYALLDQWIRRVPEWAILGTHGMTGHWGWGMFDITNQFILESTNGGMGAFVLFVMTLVTAYSYVGKLWRLAGADKEKLALAWGLGVCLFVHCASFMGVSYFGGMQVGLYMPLAIAGSLSLLLGADARSTVQETQPVAAHVAPSTRIPPRRRRLLGEPT